MAFSVPGIFFVEFHDLFPKISLNGNNRIPSVKGKCVAKNSVLDNQGVSHGLIFSHRPQFHGGLQNLLSMIALN